MAVLPCPDLQAGRQVARNMANVPSRAKGEPTKQSIVLIQMHNYKVVLPSRGAWLFGRLIHCESLSFSLVLRRAAIFSMMYKLPRVAAKCRTVDPVVATQRMLSSSMFARSNLQIRLRFSSTPSSLSRPNRRHITNAYRVGRC